MLIYVNLQGHSPYSTILFLKQSIFSYNLTLPSWLPPPNNLVILFPLLAGPASVSPLIHFGFLKPSPSPWSHSGVSIVSIVFRTLWPKAPKKPSFSGSLACCCVLVFGLTGAVERDAPRPVTAMIGRLPKLEAVACDDVSSGEFRK